MWHYLKKKYSDRIAPLHEAAVRWFLEAGDPGEAVRHSLNGQRPETAVSIIHNHLEEILHLEGSGLIIRCLDCFSPELLKNYPALAVQKAWFHLVHSGKGEAKEYLKPLEEMD